MPTPASAAISDKYLPDETELVVGVNFRGMLDSEVMKKHGADVVKKQVKKSPLGEVMTQLGLDPLKDVDSVLLAVANIKIEMGEGRPTTSAEVLMLFKGTFDHTKVQKALADLEKEKPDDVRSSVHAKVGIYEFRRGEGKGLFIAVLEKGLAVSGTTKEIVAVAIDKHQGTKKTELKSKEVKAAISRAEEKHTIWAASGMPEAVKDLFRNDPTGTELADKLEGMTFSVTMKSDILAQCDFHCVDKDATTGVKQVLEKAKAIAERFALADAKNRETWEQMFKELRISNKDKLVTMRLEMTPELAAKYLELLNSSLPGD